MKRKILAYLLAFVMAFGMLAGMPGASFATSNSPVVPGSPESGIDFVFSQQNSGVPPTGKDITAEFTDQNFRAVVYEHIGKAAPEPILDTDVAEVQDLVALFRDIKDLNGLEYFINLRTLVVSNCQLKSLPGLPANLNGLNVGANQLTELPALPASLLWLNVSDNQLTEFPELSPSLTYLFAANNQLSSLPGLPANLIGLYVGANQLTELPALPASLRVLRVGDNQLTELPALPENLTELSAGGNQLTVLPELPLGLDVLDCYENQLTMLPNLPPSLFYLSAANNKLTSLPALPENLAQLNVGGNQLTSLPSLPANLHVLYIWDNLLTELPALPENLTELSVVGNQLATLPKMPLNLTFLNCWGSGLTGILDVSYLHSLEWLYCNANMLIGLTLSDIAPYTCIDVQNNFLPDESAVTGRNIAWDGIDFIFSPQYSGVPPTGKDITAEFTDQNFRTVVYEHIGKAAPEPILDTDVAWVYDLYAYDRGIKNLDGLECFIGLGTLDVSNNQLTELPELPTFLLQLEVSNNRLTELPKLPSSLELLACSGNQLTSLPGLSANLFGLYVAGNQLTELPALPTSLLWLEAGGNQLTELPALPESLMELGVRYTPLTSLPSLPPNLTYLQAANSQLKSLPSLPANLGGLYVAGNQLTELPALPASLHWLDVGDNQLTKLPELPSNLEILECFDNQLTLLPELPLSLEVLDCYKNQLTLLPSLPPSLRWLRAASNQLTELPELPASLLWLEVGDNQLTDLPELPSSLKSLFCYENQLTLLPILPTSLTYLDCWGIGLNGILDMSYLHSLEMLICGDNWLTGLALSDIAPYTRIDVQKNFLPDESAVTGRDIAWDGIDFIFSPQNTHELIFISKKPTEKTVMADDTTYWHTTNVLRNGEPIEGGLNLASDYDVGLYRMITTDSRGISTLEEPTDKNIAKLRYANSVILIAYGGFSEVYVPADDINIIFYDANGGITIGSRPSLPSDFESEPWIFFMTTYPSHVITNIYIGDDSICIHDRWDEEIVTPATCTEMGLKKISCKLCSVFSLWDIAPLGHAYGEWEDTTPATCVLDGEETRTCANDETHIETRVIEATGHKYASVVTPPTCNEAGFTTFTCTVCGDSYTGNAVPALDHAWDTGVETIPATVGKEGVKTFTCTRTDCGETKTEVIQALPNQQQLPPPTTPQATPAPTPPPTQILPVVVPQAPFTNPFVDVASGAWYHSNVMHVYRAGLMTGTSATQFSPNVPTSRGMIVTILYRLSKSPAVDSLPNPFGDVAEGTWYTDAVKWAAANGIVSGLGEGKFGPTADVTREQLATILNNYANFAKMNLPATGEYPNFADDKDIASYAKAAVERLSKAGIVGGKPGNNFDPRGNATRAEVASMLTRLTTAK